MTDHLTKEARSSLMSRVRGRDTAAERYVRKLLWGAGFRYRLNVRALPGTPDLVLRRHKTVVFVQGCFWHGHDCRKGRRRPTSNTSFWNQKLDGNVARDARNRARLEDLGWTVLVVWECCLKEDTAALLVRLNAERADKTELVRSQGPASFVRP